MSERGEPGPGGGYSTGAVRAELDIRHTRRHMPTRRVAVAHAYLPVRGGAGPVLLGAVVAANVAGLHDEVRELLPRLVREAGDGLDVPRIALRYRLQTDTHGLDRSRHRIVDRGGRRVLELDDHGLADPQVLGAVMAAAALAPMGRDLALRMISAAVRRPGLLPEGLVVERFAHGPRTTVPLAGRDRRPFTDDPWMGVPADRRWAMEVLGLRAGADVRRDDVLRRFRRLLRSAHPDHGAPSADAAVRIEELREARTQLLTATTGDDPRR